MNIHGMNFLVYQTRELGILDVHEIEDSVFFNFWKTSYLQD